MLKRTVRDIDVAHKRVLVRVDFNVPLDEDRKILDDLRIRAAAPTIRYLRERDARVVLCSHLGRPKGKVVASLSLISLTSRVAEVIDANVTFTQETIGPEAERIAAELAPGDVLLLENLRFFPEEEANDAAFAAKLGALADIYVNDAFGAAHRAHASTVGIAAHLPAVAGLLLEKEIDFLDRIVTAPQKPLGAIIGGAKISDKMSCLRNLLGKADVIVIGGGMANTFLKAQGRAVGDSLVEDDQLDTARAVMGEAEERGSALLLPIDVVSGNRFDADAEAKTETAGETADGWRIMDAGPESIAAYGAALSDCQTVVWNGPLGVAEFPKFAHGSAALTRLVAGLDAVTIVGGGETAALVRAAGLAGEFDHVSTGGGAFLEYLEGRELPGVAALLDAAAKHSGW